MNALGELVNRLRAKGYSYAAIKIKLEKLGNTPQESDAAIAEYIDNTCR